MDGLEPLFAKPAEWHMARRAGIGASDAAKIMGDDWPALWAEKTGRAQPEDLSGNLAVVMGSFTEPLNVAWFQKQTGLAVEPLKDRLQHPDHEFLHCELDGMVDDAPLECKHVSAFSKPEEILARYHWQCQHIMAVTSAGLIYLSVIYGNSKWEYYEIPRDEDAIVRLIDRAREFWGYVERDEEPPRPDAVSAPQIAFDDMREADMTGSNEFAAAAADWLGNKDAAKTYTAADKALKGLVAEDVKLAHGHGVKVSRAKNGSLRVTEKK